MAANTERSWLVAVAITALIGALALPAQAAQVACHLTYGGETRTVEAGPTTDPYAVRAVPFGSYFLFRIVFRDQPADLASIKLTVFADRDEGPTPIHQATHAYPPRAAAVHGFTGLNFVYEPVRDGELQYWCEIRGKR
jgi:hypothetical protein